MSKRHTGFSHEKVQGLSEWETMRASLGGGERERARAKREQSESGQQGR